MSCMGVVGTHACEAAGRMFALLRLLVLQEEGGSEVDAGGSDGASATPEHYLWFRGIPNPPDDYQAPLGASPNT